jgi:hypothetical protein
MNVLTITPADTEQTNEKQANHHVDQDHTHNMHAPACGAKW